MPAYISSNANRYYTALESAFGNVAAVTAADRIPAVSLAIRQQLEKSERKDKTGSRTFGGVPVGGRRQTSFEIKTYLTSWADTSRDPGYGPLVQGCLGAAPMRFAGATAAAGSSGSTVVFGSGHGLASGQAVTFNGELRFVESVPSATVVQLNAPFTTPPGAGAQIGATVTYAPASELPSVSIFDYWSPASAVQRVLCGAGVDRMSLDINGDYHEITFSGMAQDVIDSASFTGGAGQLQQFPAEPEAGLFDYAIVPGHLGQAWLGAVPEQCFTLTAAALTIDNQIDVRAREFGSSLPRAIAPGRRSVTLDFDLFQLDDDATKALYQAGRQQSPIGVMFQLGERQGQLMGVYLKSVVPEVPEFDDRETRLQWRFKSARAQGTVDDEVLVAFG